MNTQKITIEIDAEAADMYRSSSAEEKRKLDALLSSRLHEVSRRRSRQTSLEDVIDTISQRAQRRGLTPEKLEEILDGT